MEPKLIRPDEGLFARLDGVSSALPGRAPLRLGVQGRRPPGRSCPWLISLIPPGLIQWREPIGGCQADKGHQAQLEPFKLNQAQSRSIQAGEIGAWLATSNPEWAVEGGNLRVSSLNGRKMVESVARGPRENGESPEVTEGTEVTEHAGIREVDGVREDAHPATLGNRPIAGAARGQQRQLWRLRLHDAFQNHFQD